MAQAATEWEFAAFIGIDWADTNHDLCLQVAGCEERECSVLEHTPEAIAAWASALHRRFGGRPVAICVELNKGPLVYALSEYDFLILFQVNPLTVARAREAFATSRAKDDPSDAELQLEVLLKHRERLKLLLPSSPAIRALAQSGLTIFVGGAGERVVKNAPSQVHQRIGRINDIARVPLEQGSLASEQNVADFHR